MNCRNRVSNSNKLCPLRRKEIEDFPHFLLKCQKLQIIRNTCLHLQFPRNSHFIEGSFLSLILLFENYNEYDKEFYINIINKFWRQRNYIIKVEQLLYWYSSLGIPMYLESLE